MKQAILICLLLSAWVAYGQDKPAVIEDVVILRDGSIYRGKITDLSPGKYVVLLIHDTLHVAFADKIIRSVEQKRYGGPPLISDRGYHFKEHGAYNATCMGFLPGLSNNSDFYLGFTLSNATGYQFHRLFGLGAGLSFDHFGAIGNVDALSAFIDVRGYLLSQNTTPYFNCMIGYGFGIKGYPDYETSTVSGLHGGAMFSPSIGFRLGGKHTANWFIDFGLRFQTAGFTSSNGYGYSSDNKYEFNYKRYSLRTGVVF